MGDESRGGTAKARGKGREALARLPIPNPERVLIHEYSGWGPLLEGAYTGRSGLTESVVVSAVVAALTRRGFSVKTRNRGPDIEAFSSREVLLMEAKGECLVPATCYQLLMQALGQILLRMNDEHGDYAVALPWQAPYVDLARRVPKGVRQTLRLSFWFVAARSGEGKDYLIGILRPDAG